MIESASSKEDMLLNERKQKVLSLFKNKILWFGYIVLALLVWLSVKIRTRNLPGLRDITTGEWTLGPDLDPFLFLRWSKEIVENGALSAIDAMRYVPLGFNVKEELLFHPYLMAWFHKIASVFGSTSVEHSAVIYPVFFFALTVIAFFAMVKIMFRDSVGETKATLIALVSSFFLIVVPSLLPRTIAGIPEKESVAFLFMFLSLYFYLFSMKSHKNTGRYLSALGAGISTGLMALIWGGYTYLFITIGITTLVLFLIGQMNNQRMISYTIWLISSLVTILPFTVRYSLRSFVTSATTGIAFLTLGIMLIHLLIEKTALSKYIEHERLRKIPRPLLSFILVIGLFFLISLFVHPAFFIEKFRDIANDLVTPIVDRLGLTVAENQQPYYTEWSSNFGPYFKGIPLFFWMFFIGSVYLFYNLVSIFKQRERLILTASYLFFLIALIFSRYSPNSILNGTNLQSLLLYGAGFIVLICAIGIYYNKIWNRGEFSLLSKLDAGMIVLFSLFFLSIISARGAVRLIMVLAIPTAILVSYLLIALLGSAWQSRSLKDDAGKKGAIWIAAIIVTVALIVSGNSFLVSSNAIAKEYAPSIYTQQWQNSMNWVRTNTPTDSVFAHWWDYGYWVQSMGKRATILDGGNAIPYWDYLMGRHALTGRSHGEALDFLYAHKATHLLIDSSDIGKYGAFSSIGSNEKYDRRSGFTFFGRQRVEETKNTTVILYAGGFPLDQDIIYTTPNGTIELPEGKAAIVAVRVEKDSSGEIVSQPQGVFIYQRSTTTQQYMLPLRYLHTGSELLDFKTGLEAGFLLMPELDSQTGKLQQDGVGMYLSNKTVQSQLARLYLFEEKNQYFTLAHSQDDYIVEKLKESGALSSTQDFVYYGGFRGPLRIWEIKYPSGLTVNPVYLQKDYPNPDLLKA